MIDSLKKIERFLQNNILFKFLILNLILIFFTIFFFNSYGTANVDTFLKWLNYAVRDGFINNYNSRHNDNYGPLATIFPYLLYKLDLNYPNIILIKFIQIIFFYASTMIFFFFTKNLLNSLIFVIIFSVTALGHQDLDIIYLPFLILSLIFLEKKKIFLFTVFYILSCLVKWQPIIIAPLIFLYISNFYINFKNIGLTFKYLSYKNIIVASVSSVLMIALTFLFLDPISIYKSLVQSINHAQLAGNSLNFNWLCTWILKIIKQDLYGDFDGQVYFIYIRPYHFLTVIGSIIFFITFCLFLLRFSLKKEKNFNDFLFYSFFIFYTYFMFNKGAHQNHLFMGCFFAYLLYLKDKKFLPLLLVAISFNMNLLLMYGYDGEGTFFNFLTNYRIINFSFLKYPFDLTVLFAFINLIFYCFFFKKYFKIRE